MKSEDILILLKLAATLGSNWTEEFIARETGHEAFEVERSLETLRNCRLMSKNNIRFDDFKDFILFGVHYVFPAHPGEIIKGLSTGAKPGHFFAEDLPYASLTVWPYEHGKNQGYAIKPLSPHCCFAALNDPRLRHLLAVTETMRLVGKEARPWAASELNRIFRIKCA